MASPSVAEVVVVANGCTDQTADVAATAGARVLDRAKAGEGEAMRLGLGELSDELDVVLFLDADLVGLQPHNVEAIVRPVLEGDASMACGILTGKYWRRFIYRSQVLRWFPTLTGQRAVSREHLQAVGDRAWRGYRVEASLNSYFRKARLHQVRVHLDSVEHVTKEEKTTEARGRLSKLVMMASVYWTYAFLTVIPHRTN